MSLGILDPHQWLLARYAARVALDPRTWGARENLVGTAYRVVLHRSVKPEEASLWVTLLESSSAKWTGLIWQLLCSDEFRDLHPHVPAPCDPQQVLNALHRARCLLVQHELPGADTIVDLGGASTGSVAGALLSMGYPHSVQELTIVDLPPSQRMDAQQYACIESESVNWIQVGGTKVRYMYTSMTDLSNLPSESTDMVWAGESIEHVTVAQARRVYAEAMRVLKPGGYFCLDTPNRAVTRLWRPRSYMHPEHKHEYVLAELVHHITQAGFSVERALGACPMPQSAMHRRYYAHEILEHVELSENAGICYFLYIESIKPVVGMLP